MITFFVTIFMFTGLASHGEDRWTAFAFAGLLLLGEISDTLRKIAKQAPGPVRITRLSARVTEPRRGRAERTR